MTTTITVIVDNPQDPAAFGDFISDLFTLATGGVRIAFTDIEES